MCARRQGRRGREGLSDKRIGECAGGRYTSAPTEAGSSPVYSGGDRLPFRGVCASGCRVAQLLRQRAGRRLWRRLNRAFSLPTPSNHHQACREITQPIDLSHHPRRQTPGERFVRSACLTIGLSKAGLMRSQSQSSIDGRAQIALFPTAEFWVRRRVHLVASRLRAHGIGLVLGIGAS